ncbi:MAG TPA: response regulator [Dokdonella sp.]|nr:response regulator [Dokdonella sp.]
MSTQILVVEDEADLAAIIADYVDAAGFRAVVVGDGESALAHIRRTPPALVVLDLMLPVSDGLAVCRELRSFSDLPVIMVTAKVEEVDRLLGLESGADDYLCKPFSPRELVARIRAILRRAPSSSPPTPVARIDEARRTIWVRSRPLVLTPTEYVLLAAMIRRPGVIFSRAQLLDLARRDEWDVTDRAIDTHVKNLRRKIAAIAPDLDFIQSVYGVGYRVEL